VRCGCPSENNRQGAAPSETVDQQLRSRQQRQHAGARCRIDHRHRGRQLWAEPAAEQNRIRHIADQRDAEPDAETDAELDLPEMACFGREQERAAKQQQAERIDAARAGIIEQSTDQRRRKAAGQRTQRIDRDDVSAVPAETFGNRQQEDRKALAKAASENRKRKADREHAKRGAHRLYRRYGCFLQRRVFVHRGGGSPF
jgi:hypothetical protein